jgi:hypothetical protein
LLAEMDICASDFSFQSAVVAVETEISGDSSSVDAREICSNTRMEIETTYEKAEDERNMRTWLDQYKLPQSTADILLEQGARCIEDIILIVQEGPELLEDIPPLDRLKLKKAVAAATAMDQS